MSSIDEYINNIRLVWRSRDNRLKNLENLSLKDELEAEFYDRLAQNRLDDISKYHFRFDPNEEMPSRYRYLYAQLNGIKGKRVLDICCGFGENSVRLAKLGAKVNSIDISPRMIDVTRENAKYNQVEKKVFPAVMSAQAMAYKDDIFDFVVGLGALHHLNLEVAGRELWRVLKPGGVGIFLEPRVPFSFLVFLRGLIPIKCYESPGGAQMEDDEITDFATFFSSMEKQHFMFAEKLIRLPVLRKYGRSLEVFDSRLARYFPGLATLCYWSVVLRVVK